VEPDPVPGRPIVVLGLMGAGKTTVARGLAQRWRRPLRDSDEDLERTTGRTAAQLADVVGADGLHDLEARHLLDNLHGGNPAPVIAAAASTVEDERCRAALGAAVVVWLDPDQRDMVDRVASGAHRPHYSSDLSAMVKELDARRRPLFSQVANVTVRPPKRHARGPEERRAEVAALVAQVASRIAVFARDGYQEP
jgi:shikimate kinase